MIRLQKMMAMSGVASRRASEKMIEEGRVKVNGTVTTQLGTTVDPDKDLVEVDDQPITCVTEMIYILLNKPSGFVTTAKDQFNRPTVLDLLKGLDARVYPVGRLDYQTSGLLILTNDGDLTLKLTHPKHEIFKTYLATVEGSIQPNSLEKLTNGVDIGDFITSPAKVTLIESSQYESVVTIDIREGKYRQVRRMFEAVGHPVLDLQRTNLGELNLTGLSEGDWRNLTDSEVAYLKSI
jgi:23S rRNA pseudouridine2605 synthase